MKSTAPNTVQKDHIDIGNLKENLATFFRTDRFALHPVASGASSRRYFKLIFDKLLYFPTSEIILMTYPPDQPTIGDDYLNISYYLRRFHISHPRLYEIHRERGWIFLEPANGQQLDHYLKAHPDQIDAVYPRLLRYLADLQNRATFEAHCPAFQRYFDAEKFSYEFDLHIRHFLIEAYYEYSFNRAEAAVFKQFRKQISEYLDERHPVFVHRDFQSSNIFFDPAASENAFQIIDFQDARSGNYTYDLVSLLWDSYVKLTETQREKWLGYFYQLQPKLSNLYAGGEYLKKIHYTVIQRKLHDAGAFVRAFRLLGNSYYIQYIQEAVRVALQTMNLHPEFRPMTEIFSKMQGNKNV